MLPRPNICYIFHKQGVQGFNICTAVQLILWLFVQVYIAAQHSRSHIVFHCLIYFFTFTGEVWPSFCFQKFWSTPWGGWGRHRHTNLVFSPTPSLLGDHCMRVLHLAEPNFAWGQQPKPHGYSPVGQKEMMVTGVFENTTLFSFFIGQVLYIICISSWYQPPPSNTPNMTSNCLSPAYNAPFTFLTPAPPSRWKMAIYITLFPMKEFSQSPTSMFQIARNRPEALIALHTQVQHTLET